MQDISGFGLRVNVVASITFPQGFDVTQFADDADPFDVPNIKIKDKKMGLNGDLITWSTATPIEMTVSVVPGSDDDVNLGILFEANRVGAGKLVAGDIVTMTGVYPDGSQISVSPGAITDGPVASSVASSGRLKSKTYQFTFQDRSGG